MNLKTYKIPLVNIYWGKPDSIIFNKGYKNQLIAKCEWSYSKDNKYRKIYNIDSIENYPTARIVNWIINEKNGGNLEIKYL